MLRGMCFAKWNEILLLELNDSVVDRGGDSPSMDCLLAPCKLESETWLLCQKFILQFAPLVTCRLPSRCEVTWTNNTYTLRTAGLTHSFVLLSDSGLPLSFFRLVFRPDVLLCCKTYETTIKIRLRTPICHTCRTTWKQFLGYEYEVEKITRTIRLFQVTKHDAKDSNSQRCSFSPIIFHGWQGTSNDRISCYTNR